MDILHTLLNDMLQAKPDSDFIKSLHKQYCERGGLSKKQMEGLHSKASKTAGIAPGKLATLEAIIKKRPTWEKKDVATVSAVFEKDETIQPLLTALLEKYPEHKRVLFFKHKYDQSFFLNPAEIEELKRFAKYLLKK